jgi:hypothetical protein
MATMFDDSDFRERLKAQLDFNANEMDPVTLLERVYQLYWSWADFHLFILTPYIPRVDPPVVILPERLTEGSYEFVYPIHDAGSKLSTSKAQDMFSAGMSMCKLYYTIEKMVAILLDRMRTEGVEPNTQVEVAFAGHELAQRKAFESLINLKEQVVVTNFDPGPWGERFLSNVKRIAELGFGYPPEAPRDIYRKGSSPSSKFRR